MTSQKADWTVSPQTKKIMVMQEFDNKNGVSKMDLSTGYYTLEYPLNYKKHPKFDISKYEENMPSIIKENRYDDGESYWYLTTIRTSEQMLFPVGDKQNTEWCLAKIKPLTEKEMKELSKHIDFKSKLDMDNAEYFETYLEAVKQMNGFSLGDI
jgi:hypothetical protein